MVRLLDGVVPARHLVEGNSFLTGNVFSLGLRLH